MEVRECHDKGVGICPLKKNLSFGFLFKQFLTSVFVFSKEIDCSVVGGPVAGGTSKVTVIQVRDNELLNEDDSRESRGLCHFRCRLKGVKLYEGLKEKEDQQ